MRRGVTTATDLAGLLPDAAIDMMLRVTGEAGFPARIVPFRRNYGLTMADLVARAVELKARSSDRLRLGG